MTLLIVQTLHRFLLRLMIIIWRIFLMSLKCNGPDHTKGNLLIYFKDRTRRLTTHLGKLLCLWNFVFCSSTTFSVLHKWKTRPWIKQIWDTIPSLMISKINIENIKLACLIVKTEVKYLLLFRLYHINKAVILNMWNLCACIDRCLNWPFTNTEYARWSMHKHI